MLDLPHGSPPDGKGKTARPSTGLFHERVLEIHHYTDKLFSFKTTRSPSFRFHSGQFAMIGLEINGKPLLRAYSMANSVYDDNLEFFSIKVPDGPLTSRLQHIKPGDEVLVGSKPTGTLITGNLRPGKRLILLATGTGFAPFSSILRDPDTYEHYETVIAVEGCRFVAELEYATQVVVSVRSHELLSEIIGNKLHYYATVTREPYHNQGRISDLISSGKMFSDMGLAPLNVETDRVMMCGSPHMLADLRKLLCHANFYEGSSGKPAEFVIEKAFVEH